MSYSHKLIFLVQDRAKQNQELKQWLQQSGFQVAWEDKPKRAYHSIKEQRPEVVLIDESLLHAEELNLEHAVLSNRNTAHTEFIYLLDYTETGSLLEEEDYHCMNASLEHLHYKIHCKMTHSRDHLSRLRGGLNASNQVVFQPGNKEVDSLLQEIHHRVKNNLQIIDSLISLQLMFANGDTSHLQDLHQKVKAIALVHNLVYAQDHLDQVAMKPVLQELEDQVATGLVQHQPLSRLFADAPEFHLSLEKALSFALLVNSLLNCYYNLFQLDASVQLKPQWTQEGNTHVLRLDGEDLEAVKIEQRKKGIDALLMDILTADLDFVELSSAQESQFYLRIHHPQGD